MSLQTVTSCPPLPEVATALTSIIWMSFAFFWTSYQWNHAVCSIFVCLFLCIGSYPRFIYALFSSSFVFYVTIPHSSYPFYCWLSPFVLLWIVLLWTFVNLFCWVYAFTRPLFQALILIRVCPTCFSPAYVCHIFMTIVSLIQTSFTPHPAVCQCELGQGNKVRSPHPMDQVWAQQHENCPSPNSCSLPSVYVVPHVIFLFYFRLDLV